MYMAKDMLHLQWDRWPPWTNMYRKESALCILESVRENSKKASTQANTIVCSFSEVLEEVFNWSNQIMNNLYITAFVHTSKTRNEDGSERRQSCPN